MHGLIIKSPWIEQILSGQKLWELRPASVHIRGPIALLSGKRIVASARLIDCLGPMSLAELGRQAPRRKHRVPPAELGRFLSQWRGRAYAWVLADVRPIVPPVPYVHPRGAQTWAKLPPRRTTRAAA